MAKQGFAIQRKPGEAISEDVRKDAHTRYKPKNVKADMRRARRKPTKKK